MRLRVLVGLLGLGIGLGSLLGDYYYDRSAPAVAYDPLAGEYVRLVGVLYQRGESASAIDARLARLGLGDRAALMDAVVHGDAVEVAGLPAGVDTGASVPLSSPAQQSESALLAAQRMAASGRGAGPDHNADELDFPSAGRVSTTKGDAALRTLPSLTAPILRVVPRGSELVLLGIQHGQAVEGVEDRWYRARDGDATGFVYFNLVERVR